MISYPSIRSLSFLAAGSLGLAAYLSGLSLLICQSEEFISGITLRSINLFFGLLLIITTLKSENKLNEQLHNGEVYQTND